MLLPGFQVTHTEDGEPCRAKKPILRIPDVASAERCCNECVAVKGCLGFDYEPGSQTCGLSFCLAPNKVWRAMRVGGLKFQHYDHRKMQRLWNPILGGGGQPVDPPRSAIEADYLEALRPRGAVYKGFKPSRTPAPTRALAPHPVTPGQASAEQELQSMLGAG